MNRFSRMSWITLTSLIILSMTLVPPTFSKTTKSQKKAKPSAAKKVSHEAAPSTTSHGDSPYKAKAVVLMDALSGQIVYEQDPRLKMAPASFVKILTLYLAFDAIRAGGLKMEDMATVSEKAWRIQGSKMFIKVGDRVKVEDLLKGIAISSGNDSCIALAEHMAGSEEVFVTKMNEKASALGMKDSKFMNSHGMPAEGQSTTAMDMAILARRYMEDHPEALAFHSTVEFQYNGIRQQNRNTLLQKNIGVDGLKTGHVEEAGYHLLATAKREGQRLIAVVMGCDKMSTRTQESQALLDYGFKNFTTVEAVKKGQTFGPLKVKRGKLKEVTLAASESAWVTVGKGKEKTVSAVPELPVFVTAPIQKDQELAKVMVQNEGKPIRQVGLLSTAQVEKSLIPPWPVLVGILGGLVVIGGMCFWWFRRPKQKMFGS
jgi:serine-type D-Ala-D-Ala carboxypeptidase (penicillin-binding protein 5/6)